MNKKIREGGGGFWGDGFLRVLLGFVYEVDKRGSEGETERLKKRREGVLFGFLYYKFRMRIVLCMQPD